MDVLFCPLSSNLATPTSKFIPLKMIRTFPFFFLFAIAQGLFAQNPVINGFSTDSPVINIGGSATLSWDVSNFDTLALNGTPIENGETSIPVSPLATSLYTLTATNPSGSTSAQVTIAVQDAPGFIPATGRFIEVVKNTPSNTRLHISEIEAFAPGTTPDEADPDRTSQNDLVQAGTPSAQTPPTTTTIQHGVANSVYDGDLEAGAAVWSTLIDQPILPRFMLDLGTTEDIGSVRIFGREDPCCGDRLENFTVNIYEDDGSGNPGAIVSSADYPGRAPAGESGFVELDLSTPDPGISSFTVDQTFIPQGSPITFSWTVNSDTTSVTIDQGVGDVTGLTDVNGVGSITLNPGPGQNTTYLLTATRPAGTSAAAVVVEVTDQPVIFSYTASNSLIAPGTTITLSWDVANATSLDLNGTDVTGQSSINVSPTGTTDYILTATNPNGAVSQETRVRVVLPGEPIISEFLAINDSGLLDEDGAASDWIEIHNPGNEIVLLNGYHLTDDSTNLTKWTLPNLTLNPGEYLIVFASAKDRALPGSELHTNFSLSSNGEYLALVKPDGFTIVTEFSPTYPDQRLDVSYGFDPVSANDSYFTTPTPGAANSAGFSDFVGDTSFSVDRGIYDSPISVAISTNTPGAQIRYTLDNSKPTATTGMVYSAPIHISETTVLRAAAFKPGFVPTNVDTHTYLFTADVIAHPNMRTSITQDPVYGPQMDASLKAIPTLSLTFLGNIDYTEREVSMEMINFEDGNAQVDAGMERFGGYIQGFDKVGIRVNFRKQYGPGKLSFPLFEGHDYDIPPAAQVDGLDLRAGNHDMVLRGAYMSGRFVDDSLIEMGQIAPHGRFVHIYLNGIYWGQYHMRERWNAAMLSEYFGGAKEDYEAINANNAGDQFLPGTPYDGDGTYWNETQNLLNSATPFASAQSYLDMANMIDFTLLWVSGNSESEFRSAGSVPLGVPFKFFMKDPDGFLRSPGHPADHNGPLNAMAKLRAEGDPEYTTLVADRIHKHYFNDGALTPAKMVARLQKRVDDIQVSFLSEAARWNYRSPASWQAYQDNLLNTQLPALTATMISRYRAAGMYPNLDAPVFNQHGGPVPASFQLAISAAEGTIYYTIDGTDPREPAEVIPSDPPVTLVSGTDAKTVHIPATATDQFSDGNSNPWNTVAFNDSTWISGSGGIGYENGAGYETHIDINVISQMSNLETSCLIRIPFTPAVASLTGKTSATLRMKYDDGYIAYLNGVEIDRQNFTGTPDGNSTASVQHDDGQAVVYQSIDISSHLGLIQEGVENILAIHGLNISAGSSDFLINAELEVSNAPPGGGNGGAIAPSAIEYTGTLPINSNTTVNARVRDAAGTWSALTAADFFPTTDALVVSEIMYQPGPVTPAEVEAGFNDPSDFEFLEIFNSGSSTIDLNGITFAEGITFAYSGSNITTLAPGERVLIVENQAAFEFRYGPGHPIAGQFTGKLRNEGEQLNLLNSLGDPIRSFTYGTTTPWPTTPWPTTPVGTGPSLVLALPFSSPDHSLPASWTASPLIGGTPGGADLSQFTFAEWATINGISDPDADPDNDGLSNFQEFVLISSPTIANPPDAQSVEIVNDRLTRSVTYNTKAADLNVIGQISPDLDQWSTAQTYRTIYHGDGTATTTFRSHSPYSTTPREFIRLHFSTTP